MYKKGLIVLNQFNKTEAYLYQVKRYILEFEALGIVLEPKTTGDLGIIISNGEISLKEKDYDFVIYNDKDIYIAKILEKLGYKLFNSSRSIEICDNKIYTHLYLADEGIEMPKTIPSNLCYIPNAHYDEAFADRAVALLDLPLVFKESYGSLGKNVFLIESEDELKDYLEKYKMESFLLQKYIQSSSGRDLRVLLIGGKVVAWMERVNEKDFRSNVGFGGRGVEVPLPDKAKNMAEKVAKLIGLDFCGVDILFGKEANQFYLCEVNSNAFFEELEKISGKNIAREYAKYIYDIIYK
jgi:RimK family alpha-L-glutamate ligase